MNISEKFIYHIWDAQHLVADLKTESGKDIKIIYPGRWSSSSGPDFRDAVIELDKHTIRGDVEIHLKTYDWVAHKHQEDRNFNGVKLHVVFENKGNVRYTISESGELIEILAIKQYLDQSIFKLIEKYENEKFKGKSEFCHYFAGRTLEITEKLLFTNGMDRLQNKVRRFSAELIFSDFDQISYMGIFEALGYNKNKFQMLELARNIDNNFIKQAHKDGLSKDQLIAIYLCSNKLIEHVPSTFPKELVHKWIYIYAKQKYFLKKIDIGWNLFRVRPVNHPVVRILQIVDLIWDSCENSLFNRLVSVFSFRNDQVENKELYQRFYKLFKSEQNLLPERYLIGRTRIDTITINIIIPLALLYSEKMGYKKLRNTTIEIYKNYRKLPNNYIENHMKKFMMENQTKIVGSKAIYQQGLLNIYYKFCKDHNCELCKIKLNEKISKM